jgi:trk system potassium uptake protein TrkH
VNLGVVARLLGLLLLAQSCLGLIPLAMDHAGAHPIAPWIWMCAVSAGVGLLLVLLGRRIGAGDVGPREGAAITVGAWIALAFAAALGLRLAIPGSTYVECWYEAMSGLTTCGSSAFGERLSIEAMTEGVKLWRAMLQWMGGVGIIGLGLVLLPMLAGGASFQLFRSESSGLALDRLTPRLADTVRFILVYNLALNLAVCGGLRLAGLDWFEALCHALATVSTGGFSTRDASLTGLANPASEWVMLAGMLLAGVNFMLVVAAMRGQVGNLLRSEEVRIYLLVAAVTSAVVWLILLVDGRVYADRPLTALRHAAFAVVSLGTSSGFTLGFEHHPQGWAGWHPVAVLVLMACTLGFGCTGSTVGGAKMLRLILIAKSARRVLRQFAEPALVAPVTIDGRPVPDRAVLLAGAWVASFVLFLVLGTAILLAVSGVDLLSAASMVWASLANAGPGLGEFSPERSAQAAGPAGMVVLGLLMLVGRLEFLAVLVLLSWRTWRR